MKLKYLPVFLIVSFLFSCTVYKEYQIEVYNPGEADIPQHAKKAAIIYRNFKYTGDTLQHYYKNNFQLVKVKNDPAGLDSILTAGCINNLAGTLKANNVFDDIYIFPKNTFEQHYENRMSELPPDLIEKLTGISESDLLIVLETYSSFFSVYPQSYETPKSGEVISVAVWGIYDPVKKSITERKSMIDTVYWNGYDSMGNYINGFTLPSRTEALKIAASLAGENYGKRFYADWQTAGRMYSVPPLPDFSEAAYLFEEGEVDKAIVLWEKYAGNTNGKMAINARYNLALAYELKDDLETAQKWLDAAYRLALQYKNKEEINMILTYKKVLAEREKIMMKLDR